MKLNLTLGLLAVSNVFVTVAFQWYVVVSLGVGSATDALYASMALPQVVLAVVSGSLTHVLVPLLVTESHGRFRETVWTLAAGAAGVFSILAAVLALTAPLWVRLLFPGFSPDGQRLTVDLSRAQLVGMVLTSVLSVQWSVYSAQRRFIWVELSPLLTGVLSLGILVWSLPLYGVRAAAWVMTARILFQNLFLLPGVGVPIAPRWRTEAVRTAWRRARPLLAAAAYARLDVIVDRYLSSLAAPGSLSLLAVAQQVHGVGNQVLGKAVSSPLVPALSEDAAAGNWRAFRHRYRRALFWLMALTTAGCAVLFVAGEAGLRLLIGHGGVTPKNVHELWRLAVLLSGVLVGGSMGQVFASSFYAQGNTSVPARVGVAGFTIGVALKVFAFLRWGLPGVAFASSIYYLLNAAALFYLLDKGRGSHGTR